MSKKEESGYLELAREIIHGHSLPPKHKEAQMTDVQLRRELLGELAGYFRAPTDKTDLQAIGNAMEKAMMIGIAFGHGGQAAAGQAVGVLGVPPRYAKAIIDTLEGK